MNGRINGQRNGRTNTRLEEDKKGGRQRGTDGRCFSGVVNHSPSRPGFYDPSEIRRRACRICVHSLFTPHGRPLPPVVRRTYTRPTIRPNDKPTNQLTSPTTDQLTNQETERPTNLSAEQQSNRTKNRQLTNRVND